MTRREFIGSGTAAGLWALSGCRTTGTDGVPFAALGRPSHASPNYWCTWNTQGRFLADPKFVGEMRFPGDQGNPHTRDMINEQSLFGADGWVNFYPEVRSDLFFLLDDGWDVPYGADNSRKGGRQQFGAMHPHPARFPSFPKDPAKSLGELVRRVKDKGWRGAGLWVANQSQDELSQGKWDIAIGREEWKRKIGWCAEGGVGYLKVDWGARCNDVEFRRMLSEVKREICPELIIEHCFVEGPYNGLAFDDQGRMSGNGRRIAALTDVDRWKIDDYIRPELAFADTWRIYDMLDPLMVNNAMERTTAYLGLADEIGSPAVISAEDCLYIAATLGCAVGVMRGPGPELAFQSVGNYTNRLKEVDRAVRWQRLAPAFRATKGFETRHSSESITEHWYFKKGEFWCKEMCEKNIAQIAPARVARGLPLPEVTAADERPYVACSRHPNGALSVGAFPIVRNKRLYTPLAQVRIDADWPFGVPLGVFGRLESLSVRAAGGGRVFAADLAGGVARDITEACAFRDGEIVLPGAELAEIGKDCDSDLSLPGTLVWRA